MGDENERDLEITDLGEAPPTLPEQVPLLQMSDEDKETLRQKAKELIADQSRTNFELGGTLYKIFGSRAYEKWGWESFDEYVEQELSFHLRKARYIMSIWYVCENKLTPEQAERVKKLGWTKAKEVVRVMDDDNAGAWIERAEQVSTSELIEDIKVASGKKKPTERTAAAMTFRLTTEQVETTERALKLAEGIASAKAPGRLLELICLGFIADHDDKMTLTAIAEKLFERIAATTGVRPTTGEDILKMIEALVRQSKPEEIRSMIGSKQTGPLLAKELMIYLKKAVKEAQDAAAAKEDDEPETEEPAPASTPE